MITITHTHLTEYGVRVAESARNAVVDHFLQSGMIGATGAVCKRARDIDLEAVVAAVDIPVVRPVAAPSDVSPMPITDDCLRNLNIGVETGVIVDTTVIALLKHIDTLQAQIKPPPSPRCGEVRYELDAYVWYRDSTDEWVLEISGNINGCSFTTRHIEPGDIKPEHVSGLPSWNSTHTIHAYAIDQGHGDLTCPPR